MAHDAAGRGREITGGRSDGSVGMQTRAGSCASASAAPRKARDHGPGRCGYDLAAPSVAGACRDRSNHGRLPRHARPQTPQDVQTDAQLIDCETWTLWSTAPKCARLFCNFDSGIQSVMILPPVADRRDADHARSSLIRSDSAPSARARDQSRTHTGDRPRPYPARPSDQPAAPHAVRATDRRSATTGAHADQGGNARSAGAADRRPTAHRSIASRIWTAGTDAGLSAGIASVSCAMPFGHQTGRREGATSESPPCPCRSKSRACRHS